MHGNIHGNKFVQCRVVVRIIGYRRTNVLTSGLHLDNDDFIQRCPR